MISSVISALSKKRSDPESLTHGPPRPPIHGNCGWNSATQTNRPMVPTNPDPLPYLQVFGQGHRDGRLSSFNKPVRASTVADEIRMVGQTYKQLGTRDIRLDKSTGQLSFCLHRRLEATRNKTRQQQELSQSPFSSCTTQ
jgi:hypothetical protein